jgi:peptidoglycan/xylan/chitin deacetylase (PgdA/CDA1 family)
MSESSPRTTPTWHSSVKGALRRMGVLDLLSRVTIGRRVDIFLYHGLCPGSAPDPLLPKLLPVDQFEAHIRTYLRYSRPLSLEAALQTGARGVVVTFDDGYANNYSLALPILQKYSFPATIFLTTGFLDHAVPLWVDRLEFLIRTAPACDLTTFEWRDNSFRLSLRGFRRRTEARVRLNEFLRGLPPDAIHDFLGKLESHLQLCYSWETIPELLRPLTWDQVRAMRATGLVSFGCHTVTHPVLSRCSEQVQVFEIHESKQRIEAELGEECIGFAYPYGKKSHYTELTTRLVRKAGFKFALSAESGSADASLLNRFEINRWGADLDVNDLSFVVAGGPSVSHYIRR